MDVQQLIEKEGRRRGLREQTIQTYVHCLAKFFRTTRKDPRTVTKEEIYRYLERRNISDSTKNTYLCSFKFLFEKVLNRRTTIKISHQRIPRRLPQFLTQEETRHLLNAIKYPKHQLLIKLLYATGMRVSELTSLKVRDLEFNHNYGWVRDGKGGKDRMFVIAKKLKNELLHWISFNKLNQDDYVFNGRGTFPYSANSVRLILKTAAKNAQITKHVHPHMLRHSFATHLIENGYAVTEVQPLLGHNSVNTTMIYLHTASPQLLKVESPYDRLNENQTCQI